MDHFFALCAMQVSQQAAEELRGKPPWSPLYPRSHARIIAGLAFHRGPEKVPLGVVRHGLEGATLGRRAWRQGERAACFFPHGGRQGAERHGR